MSGQISGRQARRLKTMVAVLGTSLVLALGASGTAHAEPDTLTYIHAGKLLAVPGEGYLDAQTIIIDGERISAIEPGYLAAPDGARTVDLKARYVLPGLIDAHVHITNERGPDSQIKPLYDSQVDTAFDGALFARRTLLAGFTTVQDVGGTNMAIFGLRDAISSGKVAGPRIRATGRAITASGGHGDANGFAPHITQLFVGPNACNGADDCRRAVRETIRDGADLIKITATGGVLSNTAAGLGQQLFDDELAAIVQAAHSMGRKVTAHAHGKDGIEAALNAGVDSIEHGTYLDDATIALFKSTGATLVPTVLAGMTVTGWVDEPWLPAASRSKAAEVGPRMLAMLSRAHKGGVRIAFGTDTGVSRHGENAREFALMVEAGFTPEEAIRAATVIGSEHVEMSRDIGTLVPGKYADIIAVTDNPLEDISALMRVDFVMKGGQIYKLDGQSGL
jgi:imidazolonepropionase-like amidohydrolase